jgi:transcriptional regulator with XRE-family HTH domain
MTYTKTMTNNELIKWREKNGYSQSELAKALGTHVMTVSQWERNIRTIPPFLHLALRCLELEGGETIKGTTKRKGGR